MTVATIAGLIVGTTFLLAGIAKIASPSWPTQAAGLGVTKTVASMVPWIEVALGACAASGLARRAAMVGACVLLVIFSMLLAHTLRAGRRPPCACFGGRTPRPITWMAVVRNGAIIAVAIIGIVADT